MRGLLNAQKRSKYKNDKAPDHFTIKATVAKFEKTGHLNIIFREIIL